MKQFELELEHIFDRFEQSNVVDAAKYSLLAGGKRVRPFLLFETLKAYQIDREVGVPFGCALEMIHTYSLIHDDLPSMDDDTLRRGRNTCHVEFDEATAILAGDALNTEAFYSMTQATCSDEQKIKCMEILSDCAGVNGMILGQALDLNAENNTISWHELEKLHRNKTGKLFAAPLMMGAVLANDYSNLNTWKEIGERLGLAFQIQDDIFDVTKTSCELGKSNSDLTNHKSTSVTLLGLEQATATLQQQFNEVIQQIEDLHLHADGLIHFINTIRTREM